MPSAALSHKITFVGGGQMADPAAARLDHLKTTFGIQVGGSNREAAAWGDVVVLAVKPQVFDGVLKEIGG